jgi:membrane fusion protein (multidrug efflux system)
MLRDPEPEAIMKFDPGTILKTTDKNTVVETATDAPSGSQQIAAHPAPTEASTTPLATTQPAASLSNNDQRRLKWKIGLIGAVFSLILCIWLVPRSNLSWAMLSPSSLLSAGGVNPHVKQVDGHTTQNNEEASHTYEVSKPLVKDVTVNDQYVCQIRAIQHIEIRSLEKGYLQNVLVDEGETVHKGQLLFQIKPNVYEADVQKSEAEVDLSKIELQNNQALVDKDIISPTEAAMSAAKLAKVKAELELAKTHLGFTEIRAPFDGLIGRFGDIRLGSLLEENQLLTTLSDTHRLWVYFNVPEGQYLNYMKTRRLSQNVQLELANKEIYPETGRIEVIQSDFNSTSGNIAFRASFSNPHGLLRYGETGQILWPKKISQAVIVPQKSTYEILDKRFIFVVDKTGVIHEREIKVASEEPNVYIVSSGIAPDEMFLLERQNKLDKGDKIHYKLIEPKIAIENLNLYAE